MAVGGFFSVSTYTQWMSVSMVCLLRVCVCVQLMCFMDRRKEHVFASPHEMHTKRVVHQPLTSSDRGETHRRKVAAMESHPDTVLLPWIQNSHRLKLAQSGSNLVHVNCNHTWVGVLHTRVCAHKLLVGSEV